jgi:hypothetical protein
LKVCSQRLGANTMHEHKQSCAVCDPMQRYRFPCAWALAVCILQAFNPSISQSFDLAIFQFSNLSICQSFSLSIFQSLKLSISQSFKDWGVVPCHRRATMTIFRLTDWRIERLKNSNPGQLNHRKMEGLKDSRLERVQDWKNAKLKDWRMERLKRNM